MQSKGDKDKRMIKLYIINTNKDYWQRYKTKNTNTWRNFGTIKNFEQENRELNQERLKEINKDLYTKDENNSKIIFKDGGSFSFNDNQIKEVIHSGKRYAPIHKGVTSSYDVTGSITDCLVTGIRKFAITPNPQKNQVLAFDGGKWAPSAMTENLVTKEEMKEYVKEVFANYVKNARLKIHGEADC